MSRAGGLARVRLHGNPGTPEGRKLGGMRSLKTHQLTKSGFKLLLPVKLPPLSPEFAELLGILAGDGHIGKYQVSVTTNSDTDLEHAKYVHLLFTRLFHVRATLSFRSDSKACTVVVSSREVGNILVKKGMVRGHKIRGHLGMPTWIKTRSAYKTAFIRGLFDTDGCVYTDTHRIKGREYKNIGIAFTNRSLPLLADFKKALESYGLHPTQKTKYTVFLRRKEDIHRYFDVIGSSNPKHTEKLLKYFSSKKGGVA